MKCLNIIMFNIYITYITFYFVFVYLAFVYLAFVCVGCCDNKASYYLFGIIVWPLKGPMFEKTILMDNTSSVAMDMVESVFLSKTTSFIAKFSFKLIYKPLQFV